VQGFGTAQGQQPGTVPVTMLPVLVAMIVMIADAVLVPVVVTVVSGRGTAHDGQRTGETLFCSTSVLARHRHLRTMRNSTIKLRVSPCGRPARRAPGLAFLAGRAASGIPWSSG
jgi:hypothetical protein